MKILVTGAAGFIGFHLVQRLLNEQIDVVGLDNINDYYDINLKYARLAETGIYAPKEKDHSGGKNRTYQEIDFGKMISSVTNAKYRFIRLNLEDKPAIKQLFEQVKFDVVVNLAAQAGVRYSIINPDTYIQSNIVGFMNILEACRHNPIKQLIYASSSSVYGANAKIPFSEEDQVDHPVSLYAATKKSNELMAHTYSHLYKIPTTGLRFFTVYGPWGRPDMAPMIFTNAISKGEPIKVFNNGEMERDFTYINDIVEGITRLINQDADEPNLYRLFNIGNGSPVNLMEFVSTIEIALGKKAEKIMMPMQNGDVKHTWADLKKLRGVTDYTPSNNIVEGISEFSKWYLKYFAL
ncbi:NAD-dependent epimerase/dehydratase family protein [Mangrovibacterium lignilyticum]|uniref:NAD-dependent epimerase/dehydratase family protein n=1 Tax=Mangrovibacterium lignilyticum TaxID=2668052 RepID=UPI0013D2165D|nr:NAD-dependent epimerase/dehydratase family protein [Mangrovibacterium lignilyticum]